MPTMSAAYMRTYRAKIATSKAGGGLLSFQRRFVEAVCRQHDPPDIAALSIGRGNGKSWLAGGMVARSITPDDELFEEGVENILVSSSRSQAQIVLEFSRQALGESDAYRWRNDGVVHKASRTRVRVISSDSRRALGLGANARIIVADEPAAWGPGGLRLWTAVTGALGKRKTQIVVIGTLAPSPLTGPAAFWPDFIKQGSGEGHHVSLLAANQAEWESFDEVLRVNPVAAISPHLRRTLEREHKAALASERAARTFKQYRLNLPGDPVDSQPLVTTTEWARVCARPVPECEGQPVIGVDLGGSRSWSAAAALWPSGRIEAWALAPGVPSLADQEREDQVPACAYLELVRSGGLAVDEGRAVPDVERLLSRIWSWSPRCVVSDPYRAPELNQAVAGRVRVVERARGGGEAISNVQALRSRLLDTDAGVTEASRATLGAAFAQTNLAIDAAGLTRVTKTRARRSRDDAAAALLLACGEEARRPAAVELKGAHISHDGTVKWF